MKILSRLLFFFAIAGLMTACKSPKGDAAKTGEKVNTENKKVSDTEVSTYSVTPGGTVAWEGTKVIGGGHNGTINISKGVIQVQGSKVTGGSFELDMNSISNSDQEGEGKGKLEGHLKSPDFFDAATYPTSKFEITSVQALAGEADANCIVAGNLKIKDQTKNVAFKAKVDVTETGVNVTSPQFVIDRTDWNIIYGSTKIADMVKDQAISDKIGLALKFSASK